MDEVSDSGQFKRARKMSNILDHTSENDKDAKAAIVAKIIDHEGPEFGSNIAKGTTDPRANQTLAFRLNFNFKIFTKPSFRISTKIKFHNLNKASAAKY